MDNIQPLTGILGKINNLAPLILAWFKVPVITKVFISPYTFLLNFLTKVQVLPFGATEIKAIFAYSECLSNITWLLYSFEAVFLWSEKPRSLTTLVAFLDSWTYRTGRNIFQLVAILK